ncbi:MAG: M23 family metallopeptidase [Candidatus Lindowbacteria bacterium]|nr:M23 family metallopeptidase [Candidatus Lindowbacteria bacterium]
MNRSETVRRRKSRWLTWPSGYQWRWDQTLAVGFVLTAVTLLFLDNSRNISIRFSDPVSYRFASTELALPNFLVKFEQDSLDKVVTLASLHGYPAEPWGGADPSMDYPRIAAGKENRDEDELDDFELKNIQQKIKKVRKSKVSAKTTPKLGRNSLVSHLLEQYQDVAKPRITSGFGFRRMRGYTSHHNGVDMALPYGTGIRAAWQGTVKSAGWRRGYGRTVIIDHNDGKETLYAHASKLMVKKGQVVGPGQVIAKVGTSGRAFGAHLHFELRIDGKAINPKRAYLRTRVVNKDTSKTTEEKPAA